jgi:hypothetical protein
MKFHSLEGVFSEDSRDKGDNHDEQDGKKQTTNSSSRFLRQFSRMGLQVMLR